MPKKFNSTVAGATILLLAITLAGRGLGFIREILLANFFGTGVEFESYLVGAVLPLTINTIILYIVLNYFIPVYHKQKTAGDKAEFTSRIFWIFTGGSLIITFLLLVSAGLVFDIYAGSGNALLDEKAKTVYRIMLLTIPLNAGYSVLSAYLNAEYKYSYPAVSQLLFNISSILVLVFLQDTINVMVIPVAQLSGYLIQLTFVYFKSAGSLKLFRRINLFNKDGLSGSGQLIIFIIIIESLNQLYVVFDRYYFDQVEAGGIAALNYGNIVFLLPLAIISSALTTVIFPKFSEAYNNGKFSELEKFYKNSLYYNLFIYIPIVLLFILAGDFIIRILFERGKFDGVSTAQTFDILRIYSISLLFYSSYSIISKMIFSLGLVKQLLAISIFSLITKVVFNEILVSPYQQNGLAISSTISYIILSAAGFYIVRRKFRALTLAGKDSLAT